MVSLPLSAMFSPQQLELILEKTKATIVCCDCDYLDTFFKIHVTLKTPKKLNALIVFDQKCNDNHNLQHLIQTAPSTLQVFKYSDILIFGQAERQKTKRNPSPKLEVGAKTVRTVCFTSGSTGTKRIYFRSDLQIIQNILL